MTAGLVELTMPQLYALVDDRLDGTGPGTVAEDVPYSALAATDVLPNARVLMGELAGDGAALTARGNLNRKLVATVVDRFHWRGYEAAEVRAVCKVVNEHDYTPAMYLHAVLKLAGLARRHRGVLKLTRKGQSLLPEEAAGRLQAALLRATFTRYNLAYLDGFALPNVFGPQISLILYLIGEFCSDWRPADALMRSTTFPVEELTDPQFPGLPVLAFRGRVLRYLCWFGLLEERGAAANDEHGSPRMFRKTALYDRTLSFALPQ